MIRKIAARFEVAAEARENAQALQNAAKAELKKFTMIDELIHEARGIAADREFNASLKFEGIVILCESSRKMHDRVRAIAEAVKTIKRELLAGQSPEDPEAFLKDRRAHLEATAQVNPKKVWFSKLRHA